MARKPKDRSVYECGGLTYHVVRRVVPGAVYHWHVYHGDRLVGAGPTKTETVRRLRAGLYRPAPPPAPQGGFACEV